MRVYERISIQIKAVVRERERERSGGGSRGFGRREKFFSRKYKKENVEKVCGTVKGAQKSN